VASDRATRSRIRQEKKTRPKNRKRSISRLFTKKNRGWENGGGGPLSPTKVKQKGNAVRLDVWVPRKLAKAWGVAADSLIRGGTGSKRGWGE